MSNYSSEIQALLVYILSSEELFEQWCNAEKRHNWEDWIADNGFDIHLLHSPKLSSIVINLYGSRLGQVFYHLLTHKISYDYKSYLHYLEKSKSLYNNLSRDTAGGISADQVSTTLRRFNKIESNSITIKNAALEVHEAISSPRALQVRKLEDETKELNQISNSKQQDYTSATTYFDSKGINSVSKRTLSTKWSELSPQGKTQFIDNAQRLNSHLSKEEKIVATKKDEIEVFSSKHQQGINLIQTSVQKADHWHKVIKKQFGSVGQVNTELKTFKDSLASGYNNEKLKFETLIQNLKNDRISFQEYMMLVSMFGKDMHNRNYSFDTQWSIGKAKDQNFSIKKAYQNYGKDNDHRKGYFINTVNKEENFFFNPEKKAYTQAHASYLADIKSGDTKRQARNLASLTYFGALFQADMKLATYAFLLNNRPYSSTFTPYLPLALHRQINVAKSIIRIDKHSFLWKIRDSFLVKRQNFFHNKIVKAQNYALNTLEGCHPWRGFKHFCGSLGHDLWWALGKTIHCTIGVLTHHSFHLALNLFTGGKWGNKIQNFDQKAWHISGDILHQVGKGLINLPANYYKDIQTLELQMIKGSLPNGNGFKGWYDALGRDTKGLRHSLRFVYRLSMYLTTEGIAILWNPQQWKPGSGIWKDGYYSHDLHQDLKKTEFVFKIIGIVPKKFAVKSAIHLDLIKHSLKSEIHSNFHILHPNKIFLRIPPISKAYSSLKSKLTYLGASLGSNPLKEIFTAAHDAKWLQQNKQTILASFSSKKATLISSYKKPVLQWIDNNITAKSLKTWTSSQLSSDLKQYKKALSVAGDQRDLRDGYIAYRYHLDRSLKFFAQIKLKRTASGLIARAKEDGLRLDWDGFYAKNAIVNRKTGFATYHQFFAGEQQLAIFKNNNNLFEINFGLGPGGISYTIFPYKKNYITNGYVSYFNLKNYAESLPSRLINRSEKRCIIDLLSNQSSISHYVKTHSSLFRDLHMINAFHKSFALKNYIAAVKKEIHNDWIQAGKEIFQGFKYGMNNLLVENNQTKKKFDSLVKSKNLGYKIFSDILLSYAIPHTFLKDINASASRFKYSHQNLDKDLGSIFRNFVSSSSIINRFNSLIKRLRVIYDFQRIGSIQISSKTISSLTSKWKDQILLQPIANIVLSSAKWTSLSVNQQENIINNYNAIKKNDNKHHELQKMINANLSGKNADKKFDHYVVLDIQTDVKFINLGTNMTIGQIVKTCKPSSSKWEPVTDISQISSYANPTSPSSPSGSNPTPSHANQPELRKANIMQIAGKTVFLYKIFNKFIKAKDEIEKAKDEIEVEECDIEQIWKDSGSNRSGIDVSAFVQAEERVIEVEECDIEQIWKDSGSNRSGIDVSAFVQAEERDKDKIESNNEVERVESQVKDIESYDTGSLKGDLDDQLKTDCDELTQSITNDLIADSDSLIDVAADEIKETVSDVAPKISEDLEVVTNEAETVAADAAESLIV